MVEISDVVANIIAHNVPVHDYGHVLVLTDNATEAVAGEFIEGLRFHGIEPAIHQMQDRSNPVKNRPLMQSRRSSPPTWSSR